MDEKEVLSKLKSYNYNNTRLKEIQEKIESICYKTTATYGNLAATSGGGFNSKVEEMGNKIHDLRRKETFFLHRVLEVHHFIKRSGLDGNERKLMWWIANNGRLAAFARREHIGKDNVYKIRDRAINKIIAAHETQNKG